MPMAGHRHESPNQVPEHGHHSLPATSQTGDCRQETMSAVERIENILHTAPAAGESPDMPPGLAKAMRHAVFPGGGRIRRRLCLAVAEACGNPDTGIADAAAGALELIHCASLVHDDLPCFDGAASRWGSTTRWIGRARRCDSGCTTRSGGSITWSPKRLRPFPSVWGRRVA